jgi:hypothetical protein
MTESTKSSLEPKAQKPSDPTNATAPVKKSNTVPLVIIGVVALLVVGSIAKSALSKKTSEKSLETIIEKASGSKVDLSTKDGSFSVKDKETGETATVGANQKLPSDFPKSDIPYLTEKAVTLVISTSKEGKKNWSVTTTVKESLDEAIAFFEGKIKEPEYTDVGSYGYNTSKTFTGKSAKYDVVISVTKTDTDKDTLVSYIIEQN